MQKLILSTVFLFQLILIEVFFKLIVLLAVSTQVKP